MNNNYALVLSLLECLLTFVKMVFAIRLMLTIEAVFLKFWKRVVCFTSERFSSLVVLVLNSVDFHYCEDYI